MHPDGEGFTPADLAHLCGDVQLSRWLRARQLEAAARGRECSLERVRETEETSKGEQEGKKEAEEGEASGEVAGGEGKGECKRGGNRGGEGERARLSPANHTTPRTNDGCAGFARALPETTYPPVSFYGAAAVGDVALLRRIISADYYYANQDNGAGSPLHFAVTYGRADAVAALLVEP